MDFFDPEKQKQHTIRLAIGYAVMGVAIVLATIMSLYWARGFSLDKEGRVIQNGLVFVSSEPQGVDVYMNGQKYKDHTNTRMNLPSGQYVMELKRDGYHSWKRALTVEGESLQRFDYPMLFPVKLDTAVVKQYTATPAFTTESLDRKWLLAVTPDQNVFNVFDLTADKLVPTTLTVPVDILAAGSTTRTWETVSWAEDNRHVLLKRSYDKLGQPGVEYILLDREAPAASQNLSVVLGFSPTTILLRSKAYDQYYLFDQAAGQVFKADLKHPTPQPYLSNVLAFSAEGDTVTYATGKDAPEGKVLIRAQQKDEQPVTIRQVAAGTTYLLDVTTYSDNLYVAAGAASEGRVFVYKNPIAALKARPQEVAVPVQILKVQNPNYMAFSVNKRFVIVENADHFAVYDNETDRGYVYQSKVPLDAPQQHATWMDGYRLSYVSGGKQVVFDFDGSNMQTLAVASPAYVPVFDPDYRYLYTIDPARSALVRTALRTPEDL
jgi:hypothetical protein